MKIYFEDKDNYLQRLAKADLKFPYSLIDYMQNYTHEKGERKDKLVGIIDYFEGRFVERVFAFKHDLRRASTLRYQEVIRQAEGLIMKLKRNYYMTSFSYTIVWPETKCHSYWNYKPGYSEEWDWGYSSYTNSCYWYLSTFLDCVHVDPSIKYCGFDYLNKGMNYFIEYVSQYRVFPTIEMYAKNKITYLSTDSRFYKKFTRSKEFSKYVRDNMAYIQKEQPNYPIILQAFKYGKSIQACVNASVIYNSDGYKENEAVLTNKIVDKIAELYPDSNMYLDYFNAAKKFIYMDTAKALYPDDLKAAHDYYVEKFNEQRDKAKYDGFAKAVKDWDWLNWESKYFMIMVAPSITSLANEGQTLHHCVGRLGYDSKMAEGRNLIMFIRKIDNPNTPYYTVEFDKDTKQVIQCRGNSNAAASEEINNFLKKWIKKIPNLYKSKILADSINNQILLSKGQCNQYDIRFNN